MAESAWYYACNKKKTGPVPLRTLRQLIADGRVRPTDMVLQVGSSRWVPAASVDQPTRAPAGAGITTGARRLSLGRRAVAGLGRLAGYMRREAAAISIASWLQARRFVAYLRGSWRHASLVRAASAAQLEFGRRLCKTQPGRLASRVVALDERIQSGQESKAATRELKNERDAILTGLAESSLQGKGPAFPECPERKKAVDARARVQMQMERLVTTRSALVSAGKDVWKRAVIGYCLTLGIALCAIVFIAKPSTNPGETLVSAPQREISPLADSVARTNEVPPQGKSSDAGPPLETWIQRLSSSNHKDRLAAATALRSAGADASPATQALVEALKDQESLVRAESARALGAIGPKAAPAISPLGQALGDPDPGVREAAADALGSFGSVARAVLPQLRPLCEDRSELVRAAASAALYRIDVVSVSSTGPATSPSKGDELPKAPPEVNGGEKTAVIPPPEKPRGKEGDPKADEELDLRTAMRNAGFSTDHSPFSPGDIQSYVCYGTLARANRLTRGDQFDRAEEQDALQEHRAKLSSRSFVLKDLPIVVPKREDFATQGLLVNCMPNLRLHNFKVESKSLADPLRRFYASSFNPFEVFFWTKQGSLARCLKYGRGARGQAAGRHPVPSGVAVQHAALVAESAT